MGRTPAIMKPSCRHPASSGTTTRRYRFRLVWDGGGFGIFINGEEWISDSFSQPYQPPQHRVSLGCWPRAETLWATYRNVKLRNLR